MKFQYNFCDNVQEFRLELKTSEFYQTTMYYYFLKEYNVRIFRESNIIKMLVLHKKLFKNH